MLFFFFVSMSAKFGKNTKHQIPLIICNLPVKFKVSKTKVQVLTFIHFSNISVVFFFLKIIYIKLKFSDTFTIAKFLLGIQKKNG